MIKISDPAGFLILDSEIQEIPCLINVTYVEDVPPDPTSWDSDVDFRGYRHIEYDVYDTENRRADWLERQMTEQEKLRIEETIITSIQSLLGNCKVVKG